MHPNTEGILESSLYVIDVALSAQFYEKIFGFQVISDFGERGCAMKAGTRQVLLLFRKGASRDMLSPHGGDGELHIAFAIPAALYFRDPDRHLIEVATPGVWSIY